MNGALNQRPLIRSVIGDRAVTLVSGLLYSDQATAAIHTSAGRLHIMLTARQSPAVALDLSTVKQTTGVILNSLASVVPGDTLTNIDVDAIPDEFVLVQKGQFPSIFPVSVALLWVTPLAIVGVFALLAYPYMQRVGRWQYIAIIQATSVGVLALAGLLVKPLLRPPLLWNLTEANSRAVVGNLYDSFLTTFDAQLIAVATVAFLVAAGLGVWVLVAARRLRLL